VEWASLRGGFALARRAADQARGELELARLEAGAERQRADRVEADLDRARIKLAEVEGQLETMRPQLETLDRLWVELQVAQKQAEERSRAEPLEHELAGKLAEARAQLARALAEKDQSSAQLESCAAQLADARAELMSVRDEAARLAGKLDKARVKGERLSEEVEDAHVHLALQRDEIAGLAEQEQQHAEEIGRLRSQLEETLRRAQSESEAATHQTGEQRVQVELELEHARHELSAVRAQLESMTVKLQDVLREQEALKQAAADLLAARSQIESLTVQLENQRADTHLLADELRARLEDMRRLREQLRVARLGTEDRQPSKDEVELDHAQVAALDAILPDERAHRRQAAEPSPDQAAARPGVNGEAAAVKASAPRSVNGGRTHHVPAPGPEQPPAAPPSVVPKAPAPAPRVLPLQAVASACPRLGTVEDGDTHFTFASPVHRCYALDEPGAITIAHQSDLCLGPAHTGCPIFNGREKAPRVPIDTRADDQASKSKRRGGFAWLPGRKPPSQ
jgi:hypothetical protein